MYRNATEQFNSVNTVCKTAPKQTVQYSVQQDLIDNKYLLSQASPFDCHWVWHKERLWGVNACTFTIVLMFFLQYINVYHIELFSITVCYLWYLVSMYL